MKFYYWRNNIDFRYSDLKIELYGVDDDATTCGFSRGCFVVNGTAVRTVCGGLFHLRKYDFKT